ncbi:uncharacterized protein LOC110626729 [Manihot esculenta]|uniref:uncharacterized protein LOC110626729 n=1 Tax=Manihot esculenta TaxID=3983 RepID=UPI000B5D09DA|nr:uncharacterized protein LOC110626729 [Manihot esculenta]
MLENDIIKYGLAQLSDDEDVDMMFDYVSTIRPVDSIVLYVDILSRHYRIEDGGVGPSTSCPIVMEGEAQGTRNDDDTDFLDDLDTNGDDHWIDEEDDIPGVQFNDGDDHDINSSMRFNSGYENPIRPLIFPPPYSEIDSDDKSKEFSVRMIFRSREAVIAAAKEYHMLRHHQFYYDETKSKTYSIKCKDKLSSCQWHLRASRKENTDVWKITRYHGPHTCRNTGVSKDHGHLDSRFISAFILPMIEQQPNMKIATLQAEIKDKVGYELSYKKTWMGKQFAIEKIFGR